MSNPFDGPRNPTPVPPPPRDASESGGWYQAHRELGERLGGRIEALEERVDEVRTGDIAAHGLDGKNGKLAAVAEKAEADRKFTKWVLGILASALIAGGGFLGARWTMVSDRVTSNEVRGATHDVRLNALEEALRHQTALVEALLRSAGVTP